MYAAARARRDRQQGGGVCVCRDSRLSKDDPRLWTPRDLSRFLGVSEPVLGQWRYKRLGPPFVKCGGAVRYVPADVEAWLEMYTTVPLPGSVKEEDTVRRHIEAAVSRRLRSA